MSQRAKQRALSAPRVNVSEAQIATFAKSRDLAVGRLSNAARAMERTVLRRACSHQPSSNGRGAGQCELSLQLHQRLLYIIETG